MADTYTSIPELMRLDVLRAHRAGPRGRAAAEAIFEGGRVVDEELERRLSPAEIDGLRRGLAALGEIKQSLPKP
jgi:hypothetical protein